MSFNNTKIKRLAKNISLSEEQTVSMLLKQAKYLKVGGNLLLKSYIVLDELKTEANEKQAQELKEKSRYKTKNLIIAKYTIKEFLDHRTQDLSKNTCENYVRAFSSMLQGLENSNVDMLVSKDVFEEKMIEIREIPDIIPMEGRAINEADKLIDDLYEKSYETAVIAQTQLELGFRVSEAFEVVKNIDKYYNDGKLIVVIGKGNHKYPPKDITSSLFERIKLANNLPTQRTYANHLKAYDVIPHDFRYTYVKDELEKRLELGQEYKQILSDISKEINHSREEMTNYYLKRV